MEADNSNIKPRPYLLRNKIQHYAWGTRGEDAFIPNFLGIRPKENTPYAELWMGAHPNATSDLRIDGERIPLSVVLERFPHQVLGDAVASRFDRRLPFLFKVLSIGEPLSIQAHPNKAQAVDLHRADPQNYPDDNHKPEIAIALDTLTALVGLKDAAGLTAALKHYPEILDFIHLSGKISDLNREFGNSVSQANARGLIEALIRNAIEKEDELRTAIQKLSDRLKDSEQEASAQEQLFLALEKKYPGDVGLFFIFLLNLVELEKGQAVLLEPGIPHAYLRGNIIECMAESDNVVRVGLTPKYTDGEGLIEILDYRSEIQQVSTVERSPGEVVYQTPIKEFQVSTLELDPDMAREEIHPPRPDILLVLAGKIRLAWTERGMLHEESYQKGQSILIPANLREFRIVSQDGASLVRATVPA